VGAARVVHVHVRVHEAWKHDGIAGLDDAKIPGAGRILPVTMFTERLDPARTDQDGSGAQSVRRENAAAPQNE